MKQLLILSGKGGTGKTTVAAAFIQLSNAKVFADCDVDAPNLHIVIPQNSEPKRTLFYGLPKAEINTALCTNCDLCRQKCRFGAVERNENEYRINPFACEGCSVCEAVCPAGAVSFKKSPAGDLLLYETSETNFSTAILKMGSGASGKLVSEVKSQIKKASAFAELVIIDGSPGIGCPVIASLSGADMVLIVAEPSLSGISDMERIIRVAESFGIGILVCVNKYDTHIENTERIERFCKERDLTYVGRIPYDPEAIAAVNSGQTVADRDCAAGRAVRTVFNRTLASIFNEDEVINSADYWKPERDDLIVSYGFSGKYLPQERD